MTFREKARALENLMFALAKEAQTQDDWKRVILVEKAIVNQITEARDAIKKATGE